MQNGPRGTKPQALVSSSPMSAIPPPGPPQAGLMSGTLANPYFPYPSPAPHPFFWYGQAPMYHPPFPPLHPQQYMVPPIPSQPVDYPLIAEWLTQCDNHP